MGKLDFKPGNMLYPLPAVMVSVRDKEGNDNIITVYNSCLDRNGMYQSAHALHFCSSGETFL